MTPTHAIVTAAIHDMNGFAELGEITVEQYRVAPEGPDHNQTDDFCILLDLWDETGCIDNKHVTHDTGASLLGWNVAEIEQRGRQILAQINDEDEDYLRNRRTASDSGQSIHRGKTC